MPQSLNAANAMSISEIKPHLQKDGKGKTAATIDNYLFVFDNDPRYSGIRFNTMTNRAEVQSLTEQGIVTHDWDDQDHAWSLAYCETNYNMYNPDKHRYALNLLCQRRPYNPVKSLIESIEWDGKNRCESFLVDWAKVEDTPYAREVSRLIFAGGIHRIYMPGCKFDDVPVLVGTKQGEGKSTLIRWLAMHDWLAGEVSTVDGAKAVEQLAGKWILEIAELAAFTKAKDLEGIKAYVTRQKDDYRKPYDREVSKLPRSCIFIGTSNNMQFLIDKTGNRRFYPILVNCNGYDLYDHEDECRDYIAQCWAEAKARYDKGEMPNFADRSLKSDYEKAQEEAMQDDWRIGAIEAYLNTKPLGHLVCIREIRHAISSNPDMPQDPTPKEATEIGTIMGKMSGWDKIGIRKTEKFGRQRCWQKVAKSPLEDTDDELPF